MNYKYFVYIVIPMFILGITGISLMVITGAYYWLFSTLIFWILLSGLGIAVGFHRVFSHNCYNLKPWLDNILLYCGTMACQSSSLTWVAVHIGYHHPYADQERDPHSPKKGLWYAVMGWTFRVNQTSINHKYAVKLLRKPMHIFFHKHYFKIVWLSVLAILILFGWKLVLFGYGIAAMLSILQDNFVNLFGHTKGLIGYRNFEISDNSHNNPVLGYLGWGQGWHNNHHKYPNNFNFGVKWWEFDPCCLFTPLLKLGQSSG
jgi:sn-1 stearoyl-lipid 9-desaturase